MSVKAPSAVEAGGAFLLYENHAIVAWFREALAVSNKKTPIVILDLIFRALRLGGRLAADLGVHV